MKGQQELIQAAQAVPVATTQTERATDGHRLLRVGERVGAARGLLVRLKQGLDPSGSKSGPAWAAEPTLAIKPTAMRATPMPSFVERARADASTLDRTETRIGRDLQQRRPRLRSGQGRSMPAAIFFPPSAVRGVNSFHGRFHGDFGHGYRERRRARAPSTYYMDCGGRATPQEEDQLQVEIHLDPIPSAPTRRSLLVLRGWKRGRLDVGRRSPRAQPTTTPKASRRRRLAVLSARVLQPRPIASHSRRHSRIARGTNTDAHATAF